jgi:nitroreductase
MEALEAIMSRRSIRKYKDKKIPDETITTLLKAAMNAPSAHNNQPWHFIVVDDRETRMKVPERARISTARCWRQRATPSSY